jgi:hypothetical protein
MSYELRLLTTESATGYFGCMPETELGYEVFLAYARRHPNDEFMRRHLLRIISGWDERRLKQCVAELGPEDRFLRALLWEASQARPHPKKYQRNFPLKTLKQLAAQTPLIDLKSHLLRDRGRHRKWIARFRENILEHRPLPNPETVRVGGGKVRVGVRVGAHRPRPAMMACASAASKAVSQLVSGGVDWAMA